MPRRGSRSHRKLNRKVWQRVRLVALERDGWRCVKCGKAGQLEVDHIKPMGEGGAAYDIDNLQTLCRGCHIAKTRAEMSPVHDKLYPKRRAWGKLVNDLMEIKNDRPAEDPAPAV